MKWNMPGFEINFLDDYTDDSLLDELRRVAVQCSGSTLSIATFDRLSGCVSSSTIKKRFGGWKDALEKAGLAHLYGGRTVSEKMRMQVAKQLTRDQLIAELQRVHAAIGRTILTTVDFDRHSTTTSNVAIRNRFGTWKKALEVAGIPQSEMANKCWTEEDCFENIARTWTHFGRPPTHQEMSSPPSTINGKAYETRWGTWRKALRAFVAWSENDSAVIEPHATLAEETATETTVNRNVARRAEPDQRQVPPRLRFRVFQRDRFKCVACGRSPATHLSIVLHADHIKPVTLGGKTTLENLQTLCESCNLGKGDLPG
jgi:Homing endonuclease associated repeat/HNH endonuclease